MRKVRSAAVVALLGAAVMTGCGSSDDDSTASQPASTSATGTATTAAAKPTNIAWISYFYADYQQAIEAGLKEAVQPGGGSVKIFNANYDPQKLQQQCQDAISSGRFNAIALTPVTPPTGVACATAAKAANIPVVAVDTGVGPDPSSIEPQVDGVVGSVTISSVLGAQRSAAMVKEACAGKDPCNVIVDSIPGDSFGVELLKNIGAVPGVKIVQKINTNYDPSQMLKIAPDVFTAHPEANVLVTLSDQQALAALPGVKQAGLTGKVALIGAGGSRQGAKAIADGTMFGTVGVWPKQEGKLAGEMAVKAVNGQPIDPAGIDALTIDEPSVVTPETVDQFKPEWGAAAS